MRIFPRRFLLLVVLVAGCVTGCSRHKEVTSHQRKEAASLVSEAEFAVTLRDYARAEGLLAQAVAICPDTPEYWLNLGVMRRRLDNRAGAKDAYEQMLDLSRDIYRRDPMNADALLQQVYVLALLGRLDDARAALEKAQKNHPSDRNVRAFVESRQLDHTLEDPAFKAIAL